MRTANNNYTVEGLMAKYRNYVGEHCPQSSEFDGKKQCSLPLFADVDEQLLVTLYSRVASENADKRILDILSEYSKEYKERYANALNGEELLFLCDNFAEVAEICIKHISEHDGMGAFYKPSQQVVDLIKATINEAEGKVIYIADSGYCDLAMLFSRCTIKGFASHEGSGDYRMWAFGQIRLYAAGIKSEILLDANKAFDLTYISDVDYAIWGAQSLPCDYDNFISFYHGLDSNCKMLLIMDMKDAVCMSESTKQCAYNLRKMLVEDKAIGSIVSFEYYKESLFFEFFDNKVLLLVDKTNHDVTSIKTSMSESLIQIPTDTLDDEILWPGYYLTPKPEDGIALSEIVSFHDLRKEWKKSFQNIHLIITDDGLDLSDRAKKMFVTVPVEFAKDYTNANLRMTNPRLASDFDFEDWKGFIRPLNQPCVLLFGNKNKNKYVLGYVKDLPEEGIATLKSVACLIPKDGIDVRYVAALLLLSEVKNQIIAICDGRVNDRTIPLILDKVFVPNHSEKERAQFLAEANYDALISTQKKLKEQHEQYGKAVRMRKHALTQSLSSVRSMFNALNNYRNHHNGKISDNELISRVKGTTVKEAFEFIDKNIKDMMPALEHIADVEYSFNKPEWIDPEQFVEDYIAKKGNGWLNFKPSVTWENGHNQAKGDLKDPLTGQLIFKKGDAVNTLLFPTDALERVFNNIVSNAQAHGFTDSARKDYELRFSWHTDGIALIIEIENNGTAIPSDRDTTSLLEYGVSSALHQNGHNGIGCNEIDDIMRRYDGRVEIVSSPENEFTVKYVLTFNRSNIVKSFNL